jgi:hypothetical protein
MAGVEPASETANRQASSIIALPWFSRLRVAAKQVPERQVERFRERRPTDDAPDPIKGDARKEADGRASDGAVRRR